MKNMSVTGEIRTLVMLEGESDKEIYKLLESQQIVQTNAELETTKYAKSYCNDVMVDLAENFDIVQDDWYGAADVVATIRTTVKAEGEEQAVELLNAFYSDWFEVEKLYLYLESGILLELQGTGTYIEWQFATLENQKEAGSVLDFSSELAQMVE